MDGEALLERLLQAGGTSLEDLRRDLDEAIEPCLVNLSDGLPAPAFIPTARRRDGSQIWYGLAGPTFDAGELLGLTRTCIEPGLGTVTAPDDVIDPGALASMVAESTGGRWVQVEVPPARPEAARQLGALALNLRRRADRHPRSVVRDLPHVLRDLDTSIHLADHRRTEALLKELEDLSGLTADNRCFLLVDARSRAGLHLAALRTAGLGRLLDALPPPGVRRAVLTSLHSIMSKEGHEDPSTEVLDDDLREAFEKVVEIPPRSVDDEQAELLVLAMDRGWTVRCDDVAAMREAAQRARERRLEQRPDEEPRTQAVADTEPSDDDPIELLRAALASLDLDAVAALAAKHPEVAENPMAAALLASSRPVTEPASVELEPASVDPEPVSVDSWERWIEIAMDGRPADLRNLAMEGGARPWPVRDEALDALTHAIEEADEEQAERLRRGLVHLLDAAEDLGHRSGRSALISAIRLVAEHPPTSDAEEEAVISWCDVLGRQGMNDDQAADLLLYLTALLDRIVDRWRMAWAADLLLVLTRAPAITRANSVADTWNILQSDALRYASALPVEVKESLADVATNLGFPLPAPLEPAHVGGSDPLERLTTQTVAIHTLTVSAAQAARDAILLAAPDSSVTINDDKKATDRLRALASSADYFLFTSRSCQHAASGALFEERPSSRPVLQVAGTGKSSILRRLREALTEVDR